MRLSCRCRKLKRCRRPKTVSRRRCWRCRLWGRLPLCGFAWKQRAGSLTGSPPFIKSNRGWFSVAGKVPKLGTTSRAVLHDYASRVSVGAGLARGGEKRRQVRYVVGRGCRDCVSSLLVRVKGEKLLPKKRVRASGGLPVLKQAA